MASITPRRQRKKDGTLGRLCWQVRWRDATRKPRSNTFKRKPDAERFKIQLEAQLLRGDWFDPSAGKEAFSDWVDRYLKDATHKRPTTLARDIAVLNKHFIPVLGDMPLNAIRPTDIKKAVRSMQATLMPATVRTNYGVLRAVFNAAVEADLLLASPCRGIKLPPAQRKPKKFLTADEIARLAAAVPPEYRGRHLRRWGARVAMVGGPGAQGAPHRLSPTPTRGGGDRRRGWGPSPAR